MSIAKKGETVLITGATTGIGYQLARLFAMNGYDLVTVDNNITQLTQHKNLWIEEFGITIHTIAQDLAHSSAVDEIITFLERKQLHIDILINHAGFGLLGPFIDTPIEDELEIIQVNIITLTQLTKALVKGMVKKQSGKILNVASVPSLHTDPLMSVYFATKAYVLSFSKSLTNELSDHGIQVSVLCPDPTHTEFEKRESKKFDRNMMEAEEVARTAYRQFMIGKTMITPGTTNWILVRSTCLLPQKIITGIVRKIQREKDV